MSNIETDEEAHSLSMVESHRLCVVTVTYADRLNFLEQLVERVTEDGVWKIIVVSNDSKANLSNLVDRYGSVVSVIALQRNTGSAHGFAVGIAAALDAGAHSILLLDDDNLPEESTIARLATELETLVGEVGQDKASVLAFRRDHQPDIASGVSVLMAYPPQSSFLGLSVTQVPYKIWRRTRFGRPASSHASPRLIQVPYAPYSGFMARAAAFAALGFPKKEFVLYADDTEYTWRLTNRGGIIRLVRDAIVIDLEKSWASDSARSNSFARYLLEGSDFRVFYSVRNRVCFDRFYYRNNRVLYYLNKSLFLAALWFFAKRYNRRDRHELLKDAIKRGELGILGERGGMSLA